MSKDQNIELTEAIERVTNRFWELISSAEFTSDGLTQIAVGLNALLDETREEARLPAPALRAAVEAFDRLADALEAPIEPAELDAVPEGTDDGTPTVAFNPDFSLRQFVEAFRAEAQKRLAGLSLSLTGVFDGEINAIDQTVGHLHAIRGGAGMLGLTSIASLSGVMEDVILAGKRAQHDSQWPVRALLRGFATLEAAIDEPDSGYDNIIESITDELRGHLADVARKPIRINPFEDQPVTDVRAQPLQQRILIVDDVETIAHSVALILSELNIPIDVRHTGAAALDALHVQPYSLVISDVTMPGMTGLQLTKAIRADEGLSDVPVILLTSLDKTEERAAGLEAGATDYIVKGSIGGGELLSRVSDLLQTAPIVPARSHEDGPMRRVLITEDIETIAASIAFVLSEGPYEISLAHNGREALEQLRQERVDLVISDLQMPGLDGFGLLEGMRNDPLLTDIPVILLTSTDTPEDRVRAAELGATHYLIKGEVGSGKLLEVVGNFFAT